MNNVAIRHVALCLAIGAALFLVQMGTFTPVQPAAQPLGQLAQYCAPAREQVGAPRVYCRSQDAHAPA
jgi:hypothetical protein